MIKHRDSHVDHDLVDDQIRYLLDRFADRRTFFLETVELPSELGTVPCGLWGPTMGDPPVPEDEIVYAPRGERPWPSRLVSRPVRPTRWVTVIAGPHEEACPTCHGEGTCRGGEGPSNKDATGHGNSPGRRDDHDDDRDASCRGDGAQGAVPRCEGGKLRYACVLYTAFGGPSAPQEPEDPGCRDPAASSTFWRDHALAT